MAHVRTDHIRPARVLALATVAATIGAAPASAAAPTVPTRIMLSASAGHTVTGAAVTYTATVAPSSASGVVSFLDRGAAIGACRAVALDGASGRAQCRVAYPAAGDHDVRAMYWGDGGFAGSGSPERTVVIESSLAIRGGLSRIPGGATMRLICARRSGGCDAIGTLTIPMAHHRLRLVGRDRESIRAGRSRSLLVGLDGAGKRLLLRAGRLRVTLTVAAALDGVRTVIASERMLLTAPSAAARVTGAEVVAYAKRFVGVPYVYGGNGPGDFDCSGFTSYVYGHFGYALQRSSWAQMQQGAPARGPLALGDLVFWDGGGHVGIYTGNNTFISATVHRGIWVYSFAVWQQTQSYATARQILDDPGGALATLASADLSPGLPRNGGPADATPPAGF